MGDAMTPERAREVLLSLRGPWAEMLDKLATTTFDATEVAWHKRKTDEVAALTHALAALEENVRLREALVSITKREGRFSRDPLTHASNVIDAMAETAQRALDGEAAR